MRTRDGGRDERRRRHDADEPCRRSEHANASRRRTKAEEPIRPGTILENHRCMLRRRRSRRVGAHVGEPAIRRERRRARHASAPFPPWAKWLFWGTVLAVGVGAGTGVALLSRSTGRASPAAVSRAPIQPSAVWARGARPAPDFRLTDQHGRPFSLRSLRGRPVLVTFIDPLCRNLCPLEARVLNDAVRRRRTGRPAAIAAVSVNPWGDAPREHAPGRG